MNTVTIQGYASGKVQGVGFRYFVRQQAQRLQVAGYAKNLADHRVEFLLQGTETAVNAVLAKINDGPASAVVANVDYYELKDCSTQQGFEIL